MRARTLFAEAGLIACALLGCSLVGCKFHVHCSKNSDCSSTQTCTEGFCVSNTKSGSGGKSGSAGQSGGAGQGSQPEDSGTAQPDATPACDNGADCYDGPDGTVGVGACHSGQVLCTSSGAKCLGEVKPADEVCNHTDDDCDGMVDEDVASGSCTPDNATGACASGMLSCDMDTGITRCLPVNDPMPETCDGTDNDCDGMTDEGTSQLCYPTNTDGCNAADLTQCKGICKPGMRTCDQGKLGDPDCTTSGAITPAANDPCTMTGTAQDDDCDGKIDEDCHCTANATQDCYTGDPITEDVGECKHGTQTCGSNSMFGDCTGSVTPVAETCANQGHDDDCNGKTDDVPGVGDPCMDTTKQGICRNGVMQCVSGMSDLVCVTPSAASMEICNGRDDNCNGKIDEGFNLQMDPTHCGSCTTMCSSSQTCCGGTCADTQTDKLHCGSACTQCGTEAECCGGSCANLQIDENNCGMCGHQCGANETCCGGTCVDTQSDHENCSTCGKSCATAETCCGGSCVNMLTDNSHCGDCSHMCAVLGLGLTCSCSAGKCTGTLNLCN